MSIQGKQHEKKQSNSDEKLNMYDYNFYMNIGPFPLLLLQNISLKDQPKELQTFLQVHSFHVLVRGKDHYLWYGLWTRSLTLRSSPKRHFVWIMSSRRRWAKRSSEPIHVFVTRPEHVFVPDQVHYRETVLQSTQYEKVASMSTCGGWSRQCLLILSIQTVVRHIGVLEFFYVQAALPCLPGLFLRIVLRLFVSFSLANVLWYFFIPHLYLSLDNKIVTVTASVFNKM